MSHAIKNFPPKGITAFTFNEKALEAVGAHFPGGFFIYKAEGNEELIYANDIVCDIFGCQNLEEFKELTGYTFKGMLYPDDYLINEISIEEQIATSAKQMDHVIYRIVRKDGAIRWIDDYGHYAITKEYGPVYYVFISDITEARQKMESDAAVRTAVIESLCNAYETVMLITDIETQAIALYKDSMTNGPMAHVKRALDKVRYTEATNDYIDHMVSPSDREWFRQEVCLENIVANTRSNKQFAVTYLRMKDRQEQYYRVEFIRVNMPNGKIGIIYGFKNVDFAIREEKTLRSKLHEAIDARMKQEEEFSKAQEAALIDSLTGVKNKRCFDIMQRKIVRNINKGGLENYAVVVCDINDLKKINDSWGHLTGDEYIRKACQIICRVFAHSPVFRIGGDEFAVILTGSDYEHRHALMLQLAHQVQLNMKSGEVVIASGMSEYRRGHDIEFKNVFSRADHDMYENKRKLKEE